MEMLSRFYKLFETVHGYAIDFKSYLNELDEGRFIQNSIETLFLDIDAKQLLCESLFLYGIMLLALDVHIEGQVREKLLVAYFRYSGKYRITSLASLYSELKKDLVTLKKIN